MKIQLPKQVAYIIETLTDAGFEAYAVGGCVRDSLLGRMPGDWDVTTSARPEEVKRLFKKTVDTGIEHGTVSVILKQPGAGGALCAYEVTTYRLDGVYTDGRHPESVSFTPSLSEDLRRRDFTINAMAYNDRDGLKDLFSGREDLSAGLIRCVGDADERFSEDALRILRAVRFSAQLDFRISEETERAISAHAGNLSCVSRERIQAELTKLLCSAHPERIGELFRLGLEAYICESFPLIDPALFREAFEKARAAERNRKAREAALRLSGKAGERAAFLPKPLCLSEIPAERKYLRYAMLLAGLTEAQGRKLLKELKLDNDTLRDASVLAKYLFFEIPAEKYALKKVMQSMTPKLAGELLRLKELYAETERYRECCGGEDAEALLLLYAEIAERDEPVYLKDLMIKGSDLIRAGVQPGPELGAILDRMMEDVLRTPVHNSVLYLLSRHLK